MIDKQALIIVDVQNDFFERGALAVPGATPILHVINQLLELPFDYIVASQDWHPPRHCSFASHWNKRPGQKITIQDVEQILWPDHCVQGTAGAEFVPELDVSRIDHVIHKGTQEGIDSYSVFFDNKKLHSTGLDLCLKNIGVKKLFFAGLCTEYCVFYSVMDALKLAFESVVITDAVQGLDPKDVEQACARMKEKGCLFKTFAEVRDEIMGFAACLKKQQKVKALFADCHTIEEKYQRIIDLGKKQKLLPVEYKTDKNLVEGCQSRMYLKVMYEEGKIYFETESDAIISAGLGMLLTMVYSGETPEVILKCPPAYIDELGIRASLTPGRANGLASLYLHMKREALRFAVAQANDIGGVS